MHLNQKLLVMTPEEYNETMKTLAKDETLLPGIYNFCDQWCEKCGYTDRCFTHRMRLLAGPPSEEKEIQDPEFWKEISVGFAATSLMLQEQAEELGLDLGNLFDENGQPVDAVEMPESPYSTGNWPDYIKIADEYGLSVLDWIQDNNGVIRQMILCQTYISDELADRAAEYFETIQNYALFIGSKMRVAYSIYQEVPEIMADDANGMMKIALETTQRSIDSFKNLWALMPDQEEAILNFLVQLENIRRKAGSLFPEADKFDYFKCFATVQELRYEK
jgi:hypothetical protein